MKFYHFVLLMGAVLLASVDSTSASTETRLATRRDLVNNPTKRLLRAYSKDDEERAISVKVPSFEPILNALKSSKTKELEGLLKPNEPLGNAFKALGLSKMKIGNNDFSETKIVTKFFSSRNFRVWSEHATKVNEQGAAGAMLTALTNVFGDKTVATMILLGKGSWRSKSVAKKLETALFNKWYTTDGLTIADDALKKVLKVKRADIHMYPREKDIWVNYNTYITNRVKNH